MKQRLLTILKEYSLKHKKIVLSSGKTSNFYLDVRLCSLRSEGAYLIAAIFLEMIKGEGITAVGGLTMGADPIVGAIAGLSFVQGIAINGFIVRKQEKKYGLQKLIEGPGLNAESRVLIVDDVVTTGLSTVKAIQAVEKTQAKIVRVIAVVNRLEGAIDNIAKCGFKLESIFTLKDFGRI
ncbi:MAG: orotate phosphoribosyltransferase [Candidatus Omnitrophota bacterium]|nr:MAG: orotate phosphoribosyltransferase [Candidatus Omnitrophota bacterium]